MSLKTPSAFSIPSPKSLDMNSQSKDDPTSTLDENNLAYSIFDFFIAGSETTATTLHWALLYMVAYLDIQGEREEGRKAEGNLRTVNICM